MNAEMISLTLRGSYLNTSYLESDLTVTLNFQHAREAKGPSYAMVSRELYPGEVPTAIYGTAKCVFWNTKKG